MTVDAGFVLILLALAAAGVVVVRGSAPTWARVVLLALFVLAVVRILEPVW